jgi:hypothetical protein
MKTNSGWISIKDRLPRAGKVVDIWTDEGRMTDYALKRNYKGKRGNDFFDPTINGDCCIRFKGERGYTHATHWMELPEPPTV